LIAAMDTQFTVVNCPRNLVPLAEGG